MKVLIYTKKCHERIVKLGTLDVGMKKGLKSLLKLPFSGLKFPMSRG